MSVLHRQLTPEEDTRFRKYALDHFDDYLLYHGTDQYECIHPVVREEWEKVLKESEALRV